jgi:ABC-type sulfate transport system permease component
VPLNQPERLFVESRRARRSYGLYILPIILLVLIAVWGALFVWWPLAVNPKAVWGAQESGELNCGSGTLSTYATGATVLANVVFALLGAIVVLRIAFSSSERRYLKLIDKLEKEQALPAATAASPATPATNVRQ